MRIGSKNFPENRILAEIYARMLEEKGFRVERKFGLGGTMVCFRALVKGEIDFYPEYTGTIERNVLHIPGQNTIPALNIRLQKEYGLQFLPSPGFDDTYILTVKRELAARYRLHSISDLKKHRKLRYGFNHEFARRPDGWLLVQQGYSLSPAYLTMDQALLYRALDEGNVDVIVALSTDGELSRYNLVTLDDDRHVFPYYLSAPLARLDLNIEIVQVVASLKNKIDVATMRSMNGAVSTGKISIENQAKAFVNQLSNPMQNPTYQSGQGVIHSLIALGHRTLRRTGVHLLLVGTALAGAILISIPLAIALTRLPVLSGWILSISGMIQTVPSIALLALLIPLLGIGRWPALTALLLYAILPILRNTYTSLKSVDPVLREVAEAMGLTGRERLIYIEFPLSIPGILAGIRTATVINIGTATLAAFIGAGGLGEPIVTGLSLNDTGMILEGAIPAATLSIISEIAFSYLQRHLLPWPVHIQHP